MAQSTISPFKVIVVGGSAGSLEIILNIAEQLPEKPKAIIILVLHRRNDPESLLEDLLKHKTSLRVKEVEDKEPILPGGIYLAPPDYHLLVENEQLFSLDSSERIHFSRPSIDVTFESVAEVFKTAVTGVLLSGANTDGGLGLVTIKKMGGTSIVQDPATADVGYMPQQAIMLMQPDAVLPAAEIPVTIRNICLGQSEM